MNTNFNAQLLPLAEMQKVDKQETEQLKAFLSVGSHLTPERVTVTTHHDPTERGSIHSEKEELDPHVDWAKVGKVYNAKTEF